MKKILVVAALLMSSAAFADSREKAIDAFGDNHDVKEAIKDTRVKRADGEKAILLGRIQNGCVIDETFLVAQEMSSKVTSFRTVVAARIAVRTVDKACAGEGKGQDIQARVTNLVDLNSGSLVQPRD